MVTSSKPTPGAPQGAPTPTTPGIGDIFERLAAPFVDHEVKVRQGPRGPMKYITARTARRRLNEVLGPNWSCQVEPSERWVKCAITITMPDWTRVTREALGGYADMANEEDRVKSGDSDAFKRAACMFGVGEYLYGDEPPEYPYPGVESVESRPEARSTPTKVTGESQLRFGSAREFYVWCKNNGLLALAEAWANENDAPLMILRWTPEQIEMATAAVLERTNGNVR